MEYFIIAIVAAAASLLTFFSGFGLGTILLPIFACFFSLEVAVALTGVVHFLTNLFKISLLGKKINYEVLARFGIPAFFMAILGAWLLSHVQNDAIFVWNNGHFKITWLKITMSILMLFFALFELIPFLKNLAFEKKYLSLGGLLSGFFGGFSGHQGALRSAFLIRYGLEKETLIATGVAIACIIDLSRLSVYYRNFLSADLFSHWQLISVATFSAFVGAFMGNKFLKKATLSNIQNTVAIGLILMAIALGIGVI
jgi:uncharacterized protein